MSLLKKIGNSLKLTEAMRSSIYPLRLSRIRGLFFSLRSKRMTWGVAIDRNVCINGIENLELGEFTVINSFVHMWAGSSGIKIGSRVMIASHTAITTLTHDYNLPDMRFEPAIDKSVVIEDDVWIGSHSVIMPGIVIGRGAVVGAGSVVTKSVPANAIVAGVPARILKYRLTDQNR